MQKEGYRPATIRNAVKTLKSLAKKTNLFNVDTTKDYLTKAQVSENRKVKICEDLARFYKWKGIHFNRPRYNKIETLPFIPLEMEVNQLISAMGKKTAVFLQLLKETGIRPGEAWDLKWTDVDLERGVVNVTPEKHSHARQQKISPRLIAMINTMPRKWPLLFRNPIIAKENSMHVFRRNYICQRKDLADKLQNPRINAISFKTLRHFYATLLYSKTRDLLLVKERLGHRAIQNTLIYTHLISFESDDYTCKAATAAIGATTSLRNKLLRLLSEDLLDKKDATMTMDV
jgi:integrase